MKFSAMSFWAVLKYLIIFAATLLFLAQMVDIWNQFIGEDTFVAISKVRHDSMKLPQLTICPLEGFKSTPDPSNMTVVQDHMFLKEDIINSIRVYPAEINKVKIKSSPSAYYMMCQSVTLEEDFGLQDFLLLSLKNTTDYLLFVQEPGDEHWLLLGISPVELTKFKIPAKHHFGVKALDVILSKQVNHNLKFGGSGQCQSNLQSGDLVRCVFKELKYRILDNYDAGMINCTNYILDNIIGNNSLTTCSSQSDYNLATNIVQDMLVTILSSGQCAQGCMQTKYQVQSIEYYNTLTTGFSNGEFILFVYFGSLNVEHKTEKYIYGFDTALVAVGGSMGLFLGLSCTSIFLFIIDFLQKKLQTSL